METNENDEIIKNAQYRKSLAIAYFNATNAAIELLKPTVASFLSANLPEEKKLEMLKAGVRVWRDFFLEEHKKYYAENIANIGKPYDAKETIKNLKVAKTLEELKKIWMNLSEDERRDGEILAEVKKLKVKYENK